MRCEKVLSSILAFHVLHEVHRREILHLTLHWISFVLHVLFMLRELKAEAAIDVVLDLFRQDEKFLRRFTP